MNDTPQIKDLIGFPQDIVITSHRNPDGDAIGSTLALAAFLRKMNHTVQVILPSEYPDVYGFLKGIDDILIYDLEPARSDEYIKNAKLTFCLDFNSLERIDKVGMSIKESNAKIVMIDHHMDPEPFYDHGISTPAASSTCEMVYIFMKDIGKDDMVDREIGEALMTGILTDTGSFKHNTNQNTYQIAGQLKAKGVDDYYLQDKIFNSMTEKQLRLLGHCLNNRMELIPKHKTGIIFLNKHDYEVFDIQRGDSEGIVNYLLMVKHIDVAIFVRQQPKIIKMSFRSKGDISVQALARDHFKGGGHKNASGGHAYGSLNKVLDKIKSVIPDYIPPLN